MPKKDKYKCEKCGRTFPTHWHLGSHVAQFNRYGIGCTAKPKSSKADTLGVRAARESNGWSRLTLAKRVKVSENTISRIEKGFPVLASSLEKVVDVLGLEWDGKTQVSNRSPRKGKKQKSKSKSKEPRRLPVPIEVVKGGDCPDDILEIPVRIKIYVSIERS
jgi:transcriptional regulator with XRE-family HTH domain